ncbi:MAG: L-threonylcarbamoyladenylate synthase [Candidatus Omnitrophica bacterium]|nr:L-threonylcarbamoyladenylate synthase [Candidatus Omnitrophota bacterium]
MTEVLNIDPQNPQPEYIKKAADVLKKGGLVAFPTETVYGLAAGYADKRAVNRLQKVKRRPGNKPFTVHIADKTDLEKFGCDVSPFALELIAKFWPGPLTLIFDTKKSGKTGFRMPDNKTAIALISESGMPIVAPSANLSGLRPPVNAKQVLEQLDGKIDMVLDAGPTRLGKESTTMDFTIFPYRIMREGAIPKSRIAEEELIFWRDKVLPDIKRILFVCTGNSCRSVMAEAYLKKRLKEVERDDIEAYSRGTAAPILFRPTDETLQVLEADGIDMGYYRSLGLTLEDMKKADLILVMDEYHREEVLRRAPDKKDRVYLLAEFGLWGGKTQDTPLSVLDPIGRPPAFYKEVYNIIKRSVERLVKILI